MSIIFFADLKALRLALASGAVPSAVGAAPARAGFDDKGRLWLQPEVALPRNAVKALVRYGAAVQGTSGAALTETVTCWHQLLPLQPMVAAETSEPVLFSVPDGARVPALVAELHRLGAGPVGMRWMTHDQADVRAGDAVGPRAGASGRLAAPQALLLVERPALYTLLLAGDGDPYAPRAFTQRASRVWVEYGRRHPLGEQIQPPEGQVVLLAAPRTWLFLPDGPFAAGPGVLPLPHREADSRDAINNTKLALDLRLVSNPRSSETAELWVLRGRAGAQLRALAEHSDDALIAQLSVAVGKVGGDQVAVLRSRPGKGGPPVLVLDALDCRPYLRLPNLFLPCGLRLRPGLRRDAMRDLLAADPQRIDWLEPTVDGGFTVHTMPAAAFRPLAQYVNYTRSNDPRHLTSDSPTPRFTLSAYEVREQPLSSRRAKPTPVPRAPEPLQPRSDSEPPSASWLQRLTGWFHRAASPNPGLALPTDPSSAIRDPQSDDVRPSPGVRDDRRAALESQFLQGTSATDRAALWPELASAYTALDRPSDAAVCWLNALWEQDQPRAEWAQQWLLAEARLARGRGDVEDVGRWLDAPLTPAVMRAVAAHVVYAATEASLTADVLPSLGNLQRLLDVHEADLPVRAAWLARVAITRLTAGDVVGLAHTRDRLLERMYRQGLSLDLDVPAFLRFAGQDSGERVQAVRDWLARVREPMHRWVAARPDRASGAMTRFGPELVTQDPQLQAFGFGTATRFTRAYADLVLAWGLARLGDRAGSQELLGNAQTALAATDDVHAMLLDAYAYRIREALEGRPGAGTLPPNLLAQLEALRRRQETDPQGKEQMPYYKAEKLRAASRIIDPAEKLHAYRVAVIRPYMDELQRTLTDLRALTDRDEMARRFGELLTAPGRTLEQVARVLETALAIAPRVGEAFAGDVLGRLIRVADRFTFAGREEQVEAEATAVERGLFVAAHFDRAGEVRRLLASFDRLLAAWRNATDDRPGDEALINLVSQGMRGLRRLGLRDEAERLLQSVTDRLMPTPDLAALRRRQPAGWPATLRRLLALAGGWFYVGRDAQADAVLAEARRVLFNNELPATEQTDLAVAYIDALGQASARLALGRVDEVFQRLAGVNDSLLTKTHYSLAQLRLIEAAVLAVVNDDFTLAPAARRWLDDDEYLVRRRIHADVKALVGAG